MNETTRQTRAALEDAVETGDSMLGDSINQGTRAVRQALDQRLKKMMDVVKKGAEQERVIRVNEEEILTFIPDNRTLSGIGPVLLGMLFLLILPGAAKVLASVFFLAGLGLFLLGYVFKAKVDVPDGYDGVECKTSLKQIAAMGRSWTSRESASALA
jgi:hypothetical protein